MATSPTTVLEAVNTMLSSIGEAPVNSLASGFEDADAVKRAYRRCVASRFFCIGKFD